LSKRVDSLYNSVEGSGTNISLREEMDALEYTYQNSINAGSLVDRVEKMERSVNGRIGSGSLQKRIISLKTKVYGSNVSLTNQVGTLSGNQVFKVTLNEAVSSKTSREGDTVSFTVAENVMDGNVLLVPAGTVGSGTITSLKKARSFGRNGALDITFDTDEYPNRKTDLEKLAKLKPAFKKDGSVTAGNASGLNDGASFLLLASEEAVKKYNLKPLVEIVATGTGGVDPLIMGMGPVPAIRKALKKADLKLQDMQLIELNEAFAAQSLGVIKELCTEHGVTADWFKDKTNVNGGAIALGHPVGASGNRITVTLIHEMKKTGVEYGLASLCIGGGMGTALVLKNVK